MGMIISPYQSAASLPSSTTWALVEARNCASSPSANQDFINLGGYDELLVVIYGVGASGSGAKRAIAFSDDNGSSFYGSGSYSGIDSGGVKTSVNEILGGTTAGTAAQYHFAYIPMLTGQQKMSLSSTHYAGNQRVFTGTGRVNAIRVSSSNADTLNSGTIYVYARTNAWTLAGSNTSLSGSSAPFTGLSSYDELLLVMDAVTITGTGNRYVQYSVNNGSSYYGGATDYQREFAAAGTKTDWDAAQILSGNTTSPATFHHHLLNTKSALKAGLSVGGREDNSGFDPGHYFKASASQIDAIQMGSAGTLNGGGVYVYGRTKPWTLVEARNCASSAAANQDFINLSAYEELLIVMDGVGASGSASRNLNFSVNNGSTFYAANGDYFTNLTIGGAKTDLSAAAYTSGQTSSARYAIVHIPNTTGVVKPVLATGGAEYALFVASSSQINAIRWAAVTATTLNSGTIYVFGR